MSQLKRATILAPCKRRVKKVPAPEWNGGADGFVYVRELMANEAQALMESKAGDLDVLVQACLHGVCDKDGERLFRDEDAQALREGPLTPLNKCGDMILALSGLGPEGDTQSKKGSARPRGASRLS